MVQAGCVFVAGIHPSRTWTSGSFESVQWSTCVHRLDLGFYSHPKEFWGNGVRTLVNSKGKIPSTGKIHLRGGSNPQRYIKQDSEPNTLPTSYSGSTQVFLKCLFSWSVSLCSTHIQCVTFSVRRGWGRAADENHIRPTGWESGVMFT